MEMKVGQHIIDAKSNISDYYSAITINNIVNIVDNDYEIEMYNSSISAVFKKGKSYYFYFPIPKLKTQVDLTIQFYDNNDTEKIKNITIPAKVSDENTVENFYVEFVATPNKNFNNIVLKIKRTSTDFVSPRIIDLNTSINEIEIYELKNIFNNINNVTKVGIQGKPGTYMAINGEQIRIGYRGIYEILNSITINELCILPNPEDTIIIDYQYIQKED